MVRRGAIRMLMAGLCVWAVAAVAGPVDEVLAAAEATETRLDFRVAAAPDRIAALTGRARVLTRAGLVGKALADYDRALILAPGDAVIAADRSALIAARADTIASNLQYDPSRLMSEEFRVFEGAADAPRQLVIVHAGNALAREAERLPRSAIAPALDAGVLGVTHLFTYTGQDSSIWANLALICAGAEGFALLYEVLASPEANAALDAIDLGGGRAAFDEIVARAYTEAGMGSEAEACATDRARAVRYLADWSNTRGTEAWRGPSIFDQWPVYVLDGAVVTPEMLITALALSAPDEDPEAGEDTSAEPPNAARAEEPTEPSTVPDTPGAEAIPEVGDAEQAPAAAEPPAETGGAGADAVAADVPEPATPNIAALGLGDPDPRIPIETMGVWASSLTGCITYTDAVAEPTALDAALPALNPLNGPALGTVLLTAQQMLLFNTTGTRCYLAELSGEGVDAPWQARLDCVNAIAPEVVTPLTLSHAEADGPTARLTARFGSGDDVTLLQCRPIGTLGRAFAPLWQTDTDACVAEVPLRDARAAFSRDAADMLLLDLIPATAPPEGSPALFEATLDGAPLASAFGEPGDGSWRISLGDFETIADQLATGFLLDIRISAEASGTESYLLPLLGSGRAMAALNGCAGD